jgi:hypothetical protein
MPTPASASVTARARSVRIAPPTRLAARDGCSHAAYDGRAVRQTHALRRAPPPGPNDGSCHAGRRGSMTRTGEFHCRPVKGPASAPAHTPGETFSPGLGDIHAHASRPGGLCRGARGTALTRKRRDDHKER